RSNNKCSSGAAARSRRPTERECVGRAMRWIERLCRAWRAAMAVMRSNPYGNFNFQVSIAGSDGDTSAGGFSRVSGLSAEIAIVEYRSGSDHVGDARKMPGLTKYANVTLERGVAGNLDLWQWFDAVRNGNVDRRDVVVRLLSEDRAQVVTSWKLRGCLP